MRGLNGPDFGPYSGHKRMLRHQAARVSTGLTSAHIPDIDHNAHYAEWCLNGPDFGPYSGLMGFVNNDVCGVSTGLTSAHIPDTRRIAKTWSEKVSTGLTSAHIPDTVNGVSMDSESLNGPDFGPYSGQVILSGDFGCVVSTGLTSAHIPDSSVRFLVNQRYVSTGLTSAHIPDKWQG